MGKNPFTIKYRFFLFLFTIFYAIYTRKFRGSQNLPPGGPFIIAANHSSIIDGPLIGHYVNRKLKRYMHFLATTTTTFYKRPFQRFITELTQSIWMKKNEESKVMLIALEYLKKGEIIGVFPEGTMSFNGKIRRGERGAAFLALMAKVPVVPIGLINTYRVLPPRKRFPRLARCEMNIGKPIHLNSFYKAYDEAREQKDQTKIQEIENQVIRIIMKEIARLSNQQYPY